MMASPSVLRFRLVRRKRAQQPRSSRRAERKCMEEKNYKCKSPTVGQKTPGGRANPVEQQTTNKQQKQQKRKKGKKGKKKKRKKREKRKREKRRKRKKRKRKRGKREKREKRERGKRGKKGERKKTE